MPCTPAACNRRRFSRKIASSKRSCSSNGVAIAAQTPCRFSRVRRSIIGGLCEATGSMHQFLGFENPHPQPPLPILERGGFSYPLPALGEGGPLGPGEGLLGS